MDENEFDKIAEEYTVITESVLGASGENTDFFAEYKVRDSRQLVDSLNFSSELKILDFGSGVGGSIPFFKRYYPLSQLTCLDVSRKSLAIASQRFQDLADFLHFSGETIPQDDDTFDVVFSACVFHHIPQNIHDKLLVEIRRILKPGGVFIAFEHNPLNFLTVKAVNNCPFDKNAVLIKGNKFRGLLIDAGFSNEGLHYRIFFPAQLKILRFFEKYLKWFPLGAQYYVFGQKPS
jgi:ubiquinone/menaquinone biosynthesis C-methylase UbiE